MTTPADRLQRLPRAAPARVLAVGAWLKNRACLLDGDAAHWSALHGDLGTPQACAALQASVQELLVRAGGRVDAVAHDLHPDFESTRLAIALAAELGVPAVPVQHHHAHIGVVQAERGRSDAVIGLALDGVGLGTDGTAWGGELLQVAGAQWQRLGHLSPLALPGGDIAAREPWRMAAAALHALGRGDQIGPRFAPRVGAALANGAQTMLARGLNCPATTSAGRWFDAIAGLLGFSVRQTAEAEAAIALEQAAARALARDATAVASATAVNAAAATNAATATTAGSAAAAAATAAPAAAAGLDLRSLAAQCLDFAADGDRDAAAALFHLGLVDALARAATHASRRCGTRTVMFGGGCFYNRLLTQRLVARLEAAGLEVAGTQSPGDAGLALGQAWIAAHALGQPGAAGLPSAVGTPAAPTVEETAACA